MTWLEELFRSKCDISELKCPLCRKTIHTIRRNGWSQPFDVVSHFRDTARRQGRAEPLPATLNQFTGGFSSGGSFIDQDGPSTLADWDQEALNPFASGRQFQIHPCHTTSQHTLTAMLESLRLEQELADMGEAASIDLDDRHQRVIRREIVARAQGIPLPSRHIGRQPAGYGRVSEIEKLQRLQEQEFSLLYRPDGPSYIRPWRRALQEQRELECGQEMFAQRLRRAESELMAQIASRDRNITSTSGRVEILQSVSRESPVNAQQHSSSLALSQQRYDAQGADNNQSLSYEQQLENANPVTLAELPQWMREELRWEGEAVKAANLRRPAWGKPSRQGLRPGPSGTAALSSGPHSHLQPILLRSYTSYDGSVYNDKDHSSEQRRQQAQSGNQQIREKNSQEESEGSGRIQYFDPYPDGPD